MTGEPATPAVGRQRAPGWVVWSLIVLATAIAMGATVNTWLDRQVLDTDEWVSVTDDLLADDDIRAALSTFLVAELFRGVDVQAELAEFLPGRSAGLAGPIAAALQSNAVGFVDQLLDSSAFQRLWSEINTRAHEAFVRVVRDDTRGPTTTADGAFVVDARAMVLAIAERLGLPDGVGDRIPADAGQIVVFESQQLDTIQRAVRVVDVLSALLFVVVVALYGLAVFLSGRRRVTLRNVGLAIAVGSALVLVLQRISIRIAVDELARAESGRAAVEAIVTIATGLLNELAWAEFSLGVVIALYAVLIGPSKAAVAVRRTVAPAMAHPVGAWLVALAALAGYVVVVPGFSIRNWLVAVIFAALFILAVESLRRQVVREHAAADAPTRAISP